MGWRADCFQALRIDRKQAGLSLWGDPILIGIKETENERARSGDRTRWNTVVWVQDPQKGAGRWLGRKKNRERGVCDFKKRVYFRLLMLLHVYNNRFLMLRNHTGMVVPRVFHSC